ncbi:PREDICTED: cadherin-13-like [Galeopterus variegatus]|uniref:Cadherin-13-like n=1 Tax=Galeopterus variegatus TaxID=482537 RepID=A0ABM0R1R2_GALVR|nr:PREDICTED: cadherin-13-like [Galeopterus variegatus]
MAIALSDRVLRRNSPHLLDTAIPYAVLLLTSAEDLDCTPGFQQKVFHINQPDEFIEDRSILNLTFSDCKGNNKLRYEVSSPYFKVNSNGGLVALRNITAVGRTLFVHARTPHAEDMAELVIVGGKDIQSSLQDIFKFARTSPVPRQKRSLVVSPILIPESQRQPFPRDVGKIIQEKEFGKNSNSFKYHDLEIDMVDNDAELMQEDVIG